MLRILLAFSLFLMLSSKLVYSFPVCLAGHEHQFILSSFMYPGDWRLKRANFERYSESFKHLDVITYSVAEITHHHHLYLTPATRHNLRLLHQFLREQHDHAKVLLAIGSWESASRAGAIYSDALIRQQFLRSMIHVLKHKSYGLSGIDIDWENEFDGDPLGGKAFPGLIQEMRAAMDNNQLVGDCLSLDLPSSIGFAERFPAIKQWIKQVSWVNLMAYEYYGTEPPYSELDGALGSVHTRYNGKAPEYETVSLAHTLDFYVHHGVPKNKLLTALMFYANLDHVAQADRAHHYGLRQPVVGSRALQSATYWRIHELYGSYAHPKKHGQFHSYKFIFPFSVMGAKAFWITRYDPVRQRYLFVNYTDPIAVREIARYIIKHKFLGFSAWYLYADMDFRNPDSLLRNVYLQMPRAQQSQTKFQQG